MPALKGVGLLKGLGVTFKTMSRRAATRQYPHVKPDLPARTRGVIALIEENCTVCMLCARECPDWCIYIDSHKEQVAPKEGGRARTRNVLDRFAIDYALCMYCGICVEVCPFDALHWSPEFEYAEYDHESLTHEMDTLRQWAYTVPAPDPLEEGAVEPKEVESARKAREALAAKAAAAAEQARQRRPRARRGCAGGCQAPAAPAAAPRPRRRPPPRPAPAPRRRPRAAPRGRAGRRRPGRARHRPGDLRPPGGGRRARAHRQGQGQGRLHAQGQGRGPRRRRAHRPRRGRPGRRPQHRPAARGAGRSPGGGAAAAAAPPRPPRQHRRPGREPARTRAPEAAEDPTEPADHRVAPRRRADAEHLEVEIDQATFDRLIAAGESERTARAKAKAAYARKLRARQRGES